MSDVVISKNNAIILLQALNEVCNGPDAIDDIEFHSRMGASKVEALKLLTQIKEQVSSQKNK